MYRPTAALLIVLSSTLIIARSFAAQEPEDPIYVANYTRNFIFATQVRTQPSATHYDVLHTSVASKRDDLIIAVIPPGTAAPLPADRERGLSLSGTTYNRVLWISGDIKSLEHSIRINKKDFAVSAIYLGNAQNGTKYITIDLKNPNKNIRKFTLAPSSDKALAAGNIRDMHELRAYNMGATPRLLTYGQVRRDINNLSEQYTQLIRAAESKLITR